MIFQYYLPFSLRPNVIPAVVVVGRGGGGSHVAEGGARVHQVQVFTTQNYGIYFKEL